MQPSLRALVCTCVHVREKCVFLPTAFCSSQYQAGDENHLDVKQQHTRPTVRLFMTGNTLKLYMMRKGVRGCGGGNLSNILTLFHISDVLSSLPPTQLWRKELRRTSTQSSTYGIIYLNDQIHTFIPVRLHQHSAMLVELNWKCKHVCMYVYIRERKNVHVKMVFP